MSEEEKLPEVIKADGRRERFSREKLESSIVKACVDVGVSEKKARKIAKKIADKVIERIKGKKEVPSSALRRMVLTELRRKKPEAADGWEFYDYIVKGRVTYHDGKYVIVPPGQKVYLGWQVRDIPPPGLSHLEEVEGILREMDEDLEHGISRRTIHARSRILFLAVLRSKKMDPETKKKAIELINRWRMKHGWKPFEVKRPIT